MTKWPNVGLWGQFSSCEDGVTEAINQNFLTLDILSQASFTGFVANAASLPVSPSVGDTYITNDNDKINYYNGTYWTSLSSQDGWFAYNLTTNKFYYYDGTDWKIYDEFFVNNLGTSTDNAIARFDGVTGKLIQNSSVILDDNGNASGFKKVGLELLKTGEIIVSSITGADQTIPEMTQIHTNITSAVTSISDFTDPTDITKDELHTITNKSGAEVVIKNNARIVTGTGKDLKWKNGSSLLVRYSSVDSKLYVVGGVGGAGGGGGASIKWQTGFVDGAVEDVETTKTNSNVFIFNSGEEETTVCTYKVPKLYDTGTQKRMIVQVLAATGAVAAKRFKFEATVLMAKQGDTALKTRTVSVEIGPITLASGYVLYNLDFDITDSTGKVQGTSLQNDDSLYITLKRKNASADEMADIVYLLPNNTEVYDV